MSAPFQKSATQIRTEAFNLLFSNMLAMANLYTAVRDQAPEEAAVGAAVAKFLESSKEKMRKEAMK